MPREAVMQVGRKCEKHLLEIEKLFDPLCRITLLVRNPMSDDGDLLLTVDEIDLVIASLKKLKKRPVIEPRHKRT